MMKVQRDMDHLAKHIESTFNEYLVEMLYNNRIPVMLLQHKTSIYDVLKRFVSPLLLPLCFTSSCFSCVSVYFPKVTETSSICLFQRLWSTLHREPPAPLRSRIHSHVLSHVQGEVSTVSSQYDDIENY